MVTAVLLFAVLVLPWPTLSLVATAQGGDTAEAAGPVVLTESEGQSPLGLLLEDPVSD